MPKPLQSNLDGSWIIARLKSGRKEHTSNRFLNEVWEN